MRDNLHNYVIQDYAFPEDPKTALRNGFKKAEDEYMKKVEAAYEESVSYADQQEKVPVNTSGSCATVVMIIEQACYVAHLGDS